MRSLGSLTSMPRMGAVISRNVRFTYRGNRMIPFVHYDPNDTAAYAADRTTIRLLLAMSVQLRLKRRHIDFTAAFLHERYAGPTPLFIKPIPNFDGSQAHPCTAAQVNQTCMELPIAQKFSAKG
eukprot:IDg9878t1